MGAVQRAESGYPGTPMVLTPVAYTIYMRFLRHNPAWPDRERLVLSAGRTSMLLYFGLHLTGYELSLEDFRRPCSKPPGRPEYGQRPGVETTTGPLGQGFANGVGMALAERCNRPGHKIASCSDSLAGQLGLGKLIYIYNGNHVARPADASEASGASQTALEAGGPAVLLLPHQNVPVLDQTKLAGAGGTPRGAACS
ncbi:hypothetical protein E0L93_09145 [Rubrobacter taiwanensis]|jgi:transketolase|uniref:Transketolase N-terminal domain-containing protein n=1 Tax=Rubrobacter taiwanensis TaxID=185139 RepID=A0A4R1BHY9_9ACTN|nr:hypothetical protein E0L93_09145 [Rubrobacter taiwanensis]